VTVLDVEMHTMASIVSIQTSLDGLQNTVKYTVIVLSRVLSLELI